jgi:HD-GYP domain-containing protein (c-di-GMP phosphodiesterase class II)
VRITHVAIDANLHRMLGGEEYAVQAMRGRAGHAFDPEVVACLADEPEMLAVDVEASAWELTLACEPDPPRLLDDDAVDRALVALAGFTDLLSPDFAGHSTGVADLAARAAAGCGLLPADVRAVRRGALVHDLGRVAIGAAVWNKPGHLTIDEWEQVRLHPYHTERLLTRSPLLASLVPAAGAHHERLDGSGYHRGSSRAELTLSARLLAAADAFHAMTEPRPHRAAVGRDDAADRLAQDATDGRLDPDAVGAVIEAAGQPAPHLARPGGLTDREAEVLRLLAQGRQTKQIGQTLGISAKTADRHIQNIYGKIGVSTRPAATLFAVEFGLLAWGELPMGGAGRRL